MFLSTEELQRYNLRLWRRSFCFLVRARMFRAVRYRWRRRENTFYARAVYLAGLLEFPTYNLSVADCFWSSRVECREAVTSVDRRSSSCSGLSTCCSGRTVATSVKADLSFSIATRAGMSSSFEPVSMGLRTTPVQESNSLGDSATAAPQTSGLSTGNARQIDLENQLKGLRAGIFNPKVLVIGHRGCGKNNTTSQGETVSRPSIRENTIASFNEAARNGVDFVEFDVQVSKDGHPVIFHDTSIIAEDMVPRKIGDITLQEFLGMGPQKGLDKEERSLYRKARDGTVRRWTATTEDPLCTLEEAFMHVDPSVGFNIELKFDYIEETSDLELQRVIHPTMESVRQHSNGRRIYFSSFHPNAVNLLGSMKSTYPVFFLTLGGLYRFNDERRNSIQAAITVCHQSQLQGIVTEVNAVLHEPSLISLVKEAHLWLFTFGELNNVEEAVHKQKDVGVDGVIADHVMEIVKTVRQLEQDSKSSS